MSEGDYPVPRAALVTGGAQRIGGAIARALAQDGWAVAIHYHSSGDTADALATEINNGGGKAVTIACDLTREAETGKLIERAGNAVGTLGCLINNASVFERDEALDVTRESWDRHVETNLRAPFVLMQDFAKALPQGAGGAIVNLLDERVWNLTPHFVSYTLTKASLWTLTQTMAMALAPRIRVNGIGPGPTLPSPRQSEAEFRRQSSTTPLGRGTSPEEIAAAVRFILAAPALTGQMIALDGGQHLGWAQPGGAAPME